MCVCSVLSSFSLAWSLVVNLPNCGVLLHLQNLVRLNYFTVFVVPWLASVPCKCLGNFGCCCFDLGTEDGPSVHTKIVLNLDYCSFLTNLHLGVPGFDEFSQSSWL